MKRLSQGQRIRHKKLLAIRARRRLRRKLKNNGAKRYNASYTVVKAPETFGLLERKSRFDLLRFMEQVKRYHVAGHNILFDFSATSRMYADGVLLFRAELCRLDRHLNSGQTYQCKLPHNERIRQVLRQTEILSLLNYRGKVSTTLPDVVHWRTANGSKAEGSKYEPVLGHYEGRVAEEMLTDIFVGLSEAMTNTTQHAYIDTRQDTLNIKSKEEGWWMFSQNKDGRLSILFCDLGIGIPRSLPKKKPHLMDMIKNFSGELRDSECIKAAIEDSYSRTKLPHRGKGLGQIAQTLKGIPEADLVIYSNKGCCRLQEGKAPQFMDFKDSIQGTIIHWSIPLNDIIECNENA